MTPPVLACGHGWIAIDKPSGLSTHNAGPGEDDALSVVQALLKSDPALRNATGFSDKSRPSPAHRLDRETSGVLLIALESGMASKLQQMFAQTDREMHKTYRALVRRTIEKTHGQWNMKLSDRAEGRKNPAGAGSDRMPCLTEFDVVRASRHLSELQVTLHTGRTHQIRRHAALAGHEVAGDRRYGDPKHADLLNRIVGLDRLYLHAESLSFHLDGRKIEIGAPVPREFENLWLASNREKPNP